VEFDNEFTVPVPPDQAWDLLMDIERIVPCVPGAELTEIVDDRSYKGKIGVRLGPVALTFAGQATFEEMDPASRTARIKAGGNDARGRGGAQADVTFSMQPDDAGSKVVIHTNLQLSGAVAQYGRGVGMVKDLAQQIIGQFADCLEKKIIAPQAEAAAAPASVDGAAAAAPPPPPPIEPAKPVQVGGMGMRVLWNAIVRGIKSLFGVKS
jgi:carbon monoxide dehydrogenase subunit G